MQIWLRHLTTMSEKTVNEEEFYIALVKDLANARGLALIQSPYLALRRIAILRATLVDCIRRRVRVCAFVRNPSQSAADLATDAETKRNQETMDAANLLLSLGVHVTFRPHIHEKVATIDENILWDGSLNIMSQNKSSERMTRFWNREKVYDTIQMHRLDGCLSCLRRRLSIKGEAESEQDLLRTIGKVVEKRRKYLNLSQIELARKVGVGQATISNIESGKGKASMKNFQLVCCELQLHLRALPWYLSPSLNQWELDIARTEEEELLEQQRHREKQEFERMNGPKAKSLLLLTPTPTPIKPLESPPRDAKP